MAQFLYFALTRAVMALFTLLLVSLIVFSLMEMVPGTCAERYLAFKNTQGQQISVEDIRAEERRLGLDKPFIQRWVGLGWQCISAWRIRRQLYSAPQYQPVTGG